MLLKMVYFFSNPRAKGFSVKLISNESVVLLWVIRYCFGCSFKPIFDTFLHTFIERLLNQVNGPVLSAWIKMVPKSFGEGWTPFHWRYKQTHRFPNWSNVSCRSMRAWPRDFNVLDSSFLEKEVCVNNATTSVPALPSPFLKVPRTSFWTWPQTGLGTSLGFFLSSSVFRYVKM